MSFFGSAPSQFLLNGVFRVHVNKYSTSDPEFSSFMLRQLYVDDLNGSVAGVKEAKEIYEKVKSRFSEVGFNFRKWRSNDPDVMNHIAAKETVDADEGRKDVKVLGILWNPKDDLLSIDVKRFVENAE